MSIDKIDPIVKRWSARTRNILKSSISSAGIRTYSGQLNKGIAYSIARRYAIPWKISFNFPKHGIFVEKGVGRGYPIGRVGQASADAKSRRHPKPWFNPVMEGQLPLLANDMNLQIAKDAIQHVKIK